MKNTARCKSAVFFFLSVSRGWVRIVSDETSSYYLRGMSCCLAGALSGHRSKQGPIFCTRFPVHSFVCYFAVAGVCVASKKGINRFAEYAYRCPVCCGANYRVDFAVYRPANP